jgi:hypothetical protein
LLVSRKKRKKKFKEETHVFGIEIFRHLVDRFRDLLLGRRLVVQEKPTVKKNQIVIFFVGYSVKVDSQLGPSKSR